MNTRGYNHNACFICNKSPYKNPGISLHRFPSCKNLRLLWLKACNLTEDDYRTSRRLCSNHFDKNCFNTTYVRKCLKFGSVPTIFTEELEIPTLEENSEDKNVKLNTTLKEPPDKKEIRFCPPTMVRYDNPFNPYYSTQWICKNCLSAMLSEDAVRKHLRIKCKPKNIAYFPENLPNVDNEDIGDEDEDHDDEDEDHDDEDEDHDDEDEDDEDGDDDEDDDDEDDEDDDYEDNNGVDDDDDDDDEGEEDYDDDPLKSSNSV